MLTREQLERKKLIRKAFVEYVRLHYSEPGDPTSNMLQHWDTGLSRLPRYKQLAEILMGLIESLSIRGITGKVDGVTFFIEADECEDYSRYMRPPVKVLSV